MEIKELKELKKSLLSNKGENPNLTLVKDEVAIILIESIGVTILVNVNGQEIQIFKNE